MKTHLIKVYHSYWEGRKYMQNFFEDISKTLQWKKMTLWVNFKAGEIFYSHTSNDTSYRSFESKFYSYFNSFQLTPDDTWVWEYDITKTVVWELRLENNWFYPFKYSTWDETDFILNIFRSFENFAWYQDKAWLYLEIESIAEEGTMFYILSRMKYKIFKLCLLGRFFKYIFNHKISSNWKNTWDKYYNYKLSRDLSKAKIYFVMQSSNKEVAIEKLKSLFNNFLVFKHYPLNQFKLYIHKDITSIKDWSIWSIQMKNYIYSPEELSNIFHFPNNPASETTLHKVSSQKLALPIWVPTFDYRHSKNHEIIAQDYPRNINIVGSSDYRSVTVPVWIYDEDRLRHMYIIWKTGTGKSKFLNSLMIDDILQGKWLWVIDPHGDLIEEILAHIPPERIKDVIIFDPTDEEFPFCFNPLDIKSTESKQILAKWFIDIFKKFFWWNWNPKLEHVLRMIFLALLDTPNATLFDIIRSLTDKDFRYEMIEHIQDDVVKNFWTNEFASWSQQFNSEAIMPIMNKVGQLLSIDMLKNIFSSHENKLDFREMMDQQKILLVKLPKWKLQEEIMWFLWAMFVTKIYQAAMGRQSIAKSERIPYYLYVDEFQNFATDTFNEILSEARKYWLSLTVAHQFIKQIPSNISDALFWNVGTLISFRVSSEDALYMAKHFDPFLTAYDLSNLNQREFYCKLLVQWYVKDPFSLKSMYIPDIETNLKQLQSIYTISRTRYARSLHEAKRIIATEQKDIVEKIESFTEPLL